MRVGGNLGGLKPSAKRALERILQRRVPPNLLVSLELARHLARISAEVGRQVGILVSRRGHVEAVFVGEPERIYLPDVGRSRTGPRQFRGQRHIHTRLGPAALTQDDLTDLERLGLDAVVALGVEAGGQAAAVHYAYLSSDGGAAVQVCRGEAASVGVLAPDLGEHVVMSARAARGERLKVAQAQARAVVLGVYPNRETSTWRLAEMRELCATAGVDVVDSMVQLRQRVDSHFVVGRGKLEDAVLRCLDLGAELLVVDHSLTPTQARAIAATSDLKVIDRTQLILDIFAQHAQSRDGKLQVELAQLRYTLPRLTDMDAGMSRLTGGIGGRGPGETKLEINRRRARDRMVRLEKEIAQLSRARALRRHRRQHSGLPVVSLIGYTNAGKSTLLNRLTRSDVLVADQLFATLDPTSRRLFLPEVGEAILTDTVGFIHDLPKELTKAFYATLEELEGADLLVHVVDAGDRRRREKMAAVEVILDDLDLGSIDRLVAYNKADTLAPFAAQALAEQAAGVSVSARTGDGMAALRAGLVARLTSRRRGP